MALVSKIGRDFVLLFSVLMVRKCHEDFTVFAQLQWQILLTRQIIELAAYRKICAQFISSDQAGSEAKEGVGSGRSL